MFVTFLIFQFEACRQLVWNMLSQDPKSRPTVWDLLESKSLKRYKSKEESLQVKKKNSINFM